MTEDDTDHTHESTAEPDKRARTASSPRGDDAGTAASRVDDPGPVASGVDAADAGSTPTMSRRGLLQTVGVAVAGGVAGTGTWSESAAAETATGEGAWVSHHGLTARAYQRRFDEYLDDGYRLTNVAGYGVDGEARYAAIWERRDGPAFRARHGLTASQYQRAFERHVGDGFRLTNVSAYTVAGESRYAAMWERRGGPRWVARHGLTSTEYQRAFEKHVGNGYRPVCVSGHGVDGEERYAAVWEKRGGPAFQARHGLTAEQYQNAFDDLLDRGYRLVDVSAFAVDGAPRFAAIWERRGGPGFQARHGLTSTEYQAAFDELAYQGYRPVDVSGYAVPGAVVPNPLDDGPERYAAIWEADGLSQRAIDAIDQRVNGYMNQFGIPGLSVAISKDERLVFAKGYGLADRDAGEEVRPHHRFRIASLSKPITSVAVNRLVEAGDLARDDRVFGDGGVLGTTYGTPTYDDDIDAADPGPITVEHLLTHTSGWRFPRNDDPMFKHEGKSQDDLVEFVLANRPVTAAPGAGYHYLNFGYCLLGRVIEAVTGRDYEDYVADEVLAPCGVDGMAIAGDSKADRRPDEVVYYGGNAYGERVARMDAHGGWIATPIDLLRVTARVDGFGAKPDILGQASIDEMVDREPPNRGYAEGWITAPSWRGHDGSLPGSIGFLVRRDDGFSFAALANTRPGNSRRAIGQLRQTVNNAIGAVDDWPDYDLF